MGQTYIFIFIQTPYNDFAKLHKSLKALVIRVIRSYLYISSKKDIVMQLQVLQVNPLLYLIIGNVAISYMMSFGGWQQLAQSYKANTQFVGTRLNFQAAIINNSGKYSGTINIGVNPSGLHLCCIILLRPGHPPLFIPWSEISVSRYQENSQYTIQLQTTKQPSIPIRITEHLFHEITALSGGQISINELV